MSDSKNACAKCGADLTSQKWKDDTRVEKFFKVCEKGHKTFYTQPARISEDPPTPAGPEKAVEAPAPEKLETPPPPEAPPPPAEPTPPPAPVEAASPPAAAEPPAAPTPPPAAEGPAREEPRYTPGPPTPPESKGGGAGLAVALVVGAAAIAALAVGLAKKGGYNDKGNAPQR